jgi:hypothetical protein
LKAIEARRRIEAAKLGWERRKQKALEEAFKEAEKKRQARIGNVPSIALRNLMTDPRWLDGSYHVFEDGTEEGQLVCAPGPPEQIRDRVIEVEQATLVIIRKEPVWIQIGIISIPIDIGDRDLDQYEKFWGRVITLTFPRKAIYIAESFVACREIAENMLAAGFKILGVVVRTTFGERPDRYEER